MNQNVLNNCVYNSAANGIKENINYFLEKGAERLPKFLAFIICDQKELFRKYFNAQIDNTKEICLAAGSQGSIEIITYLGGYVDTPFLEYCICGTTRAN